MSSFAVKVVPVTIHNHPNADALEIAKVGDYMSIVRKGEFETGDRVAYIPEASVLPDELIVQMGLEGRLAGSKHNRVKAVKLRGVLSQGLCLRAKVDWQINDDVTDELGVVKYEPIIPVGMAGEVYPLEHHESLHFDIENIKAHPNIFKEGEEVVFTEKIHGTFMMSVGLPKNMARDTHLGHGADGRFAVSSKGLMNKHLGIKHSPNNENNIYIRTAKTYQLDNKLPEIAEKLGKPVFVLGEVAGSGIQDLTYGQSGNHHLFRVFMVQIGNEVLSDWEMTDFLKTIELDRVPVLYRGLFNKDVLDKYTNGTETLSGKSLHVREGVVITPSNERVHPDIGRVVLKSVSEKYLLRKNGTEYN